MRAALLMLTAGTVWAGEAFGLWTLNPARSTLTGNEKRVTLRIEPHMRGEVFTMYTTTSDGRASTSSTILYLDGKPRDFHDLACSGTQSSRRLDSETVQILRQCANGERVQLVRRTAEPGALILEITKQLARGRRSEARLVMEKQ